MRGRWLVLVLLSLATAGCGDDGSGGGSPGSGVSQNLPPVFTSAATASVVEGTTGTVYQAAASDPESQALTFSIAGGADAGRFAITPGGALSFVAAPDFAHPTDADRNNVYLVRLAASDGVNSTTLDVAVTVTAKPATFRVRQLTRVGESPVQLAAIPGDDQHFVVLAKTYLWTVDRLSGANALLMLSELPEDNRFGCGLQVRSIAFSPNFATDRTFYAAGWCSLQFLEIRRFRVPAGGGMVTDQGERVMKSDVNGFGDAGEAATVEMRFGPDGLLYLATGDQSGDFGVHPGPNTNGFSRDLSRLSGKVLRIDVSGDGFPADPNRNYRIPPANPFAAGGGAPEILAYGFHIPRGLEFNGQNVLLADRGYYAAANAPNPVHEIDLITPANAGGDYGFYNCQGDRNFAGTGPCASPTILPVIQASDPALDVMRRYLIGGIVYDGPIVELRGQYLFGFGNPDKVHPPSIWTASVAQLQQGANLPLTSLRDRTADFKPAVPIDAIMAFGKDLAGNAYILAEDGNVFIVEPLP